MSNPTQETLSDIARASRLKTLDLVYKAQTSHIGSLFSCAEIFATIFSKIDLEKDKMVLSAGWKAAMLYYHLWRKGKITTEQLDSYCQDGSPFIGLAEPIIPDIPLSGGSMGLGMPGAVGLALAKKLKGEDGTVYCLMSDGEMQIGTTWESALIATQQKLDNLVVIVDWNGLQAMGPTDDILSLGDLKNKWRLFNWCATSLDGHDFEQINWALSKPNLHGPYIILAHTTKGKGVSFMENNNLYHYKQLSDEEYNNAKAELNGGNN